MSGSTSFGAWVRQRRAALGFTREQLADRVHCDPETIRKIEAGSRRPSVEMARALARALRIPEDEVPAFIEFARQGARVDAPVVVGPGGVLSPPPRVAPPGNLPAWRTSFVGRAREVEQVRAYLARPEVRLVTLLGAPGIGKSRLALQVAAGLRAEFPDGVFFVALSALTDPAQVGPAIARALDLKEATSRPPVELVQEYLRHKKLLLLLDNFEHLADAATLVGTLIEACPDLKLIVTSRTALYVYGEQQFPLAPLLLPDPETPLAPEALMQYDAVVLFDQRARATRPLFLLTPQTVPVVVEICRQLDGLPLAIELAAARIKLLTPREILARLTHRLTLLTAGSADLPPRQRTLRAAIDWSYDLLDAADRRLFRRLAVFVRGATLDTIAAVCGLPGEPPGDPALGVASLLDKSLLNTEIQPDGTTRYWMLWTISEYGLARLAEAGEEDAIRRQHAAYYHELAEAAEPHLRSAARGPWLERLEQELHNLRAALTWDLADAARAADGLALAGALHWFWYFRGYLTEGRMWLEQALSLAGSGRRTAAGAKALNAAGRFAFLQDDYAAMRPLLEESVAIWQATADHQSLAYALMNLGIATVYRHREVSSGGHCLIEKALALFQETGDTWGLAFALDLMGDAAGLLHQPEHEITRYKEESLALYRSLGDKWGVATELSELGHAALRNGDYALAQARLEEALPLERLVGDRWLMAHSVSSLGVVAWHQGDYKQASALYEESLALYRGLGDRLGTAGALRYLGHLAYDQGTYTKAAAYFKEALTIVFQLGSEQTAALCLAGLAGVASAQGHLPRAVRLFGVADALRIASHGLVPPADGVHYHHHLAALRTMLDEAAFAHAWHQGQAMTLAQAVAYANSDGLDP